MKEYVRYSKHDNFAAFIIDGGQHGFINKKAFFTIGTDGKYHLGQSAFSPLGTRNVERKEPVVVSLLQFMKELSNEKRTSNLISECHGKVVKGGRKTLKETQCADLIVND